MYLAHSTIQNMCVPANGNMAKDSITFQEKAIFPISLSCEMLVACLTLEEKYYDSEE